MNDFYFCTSVLAHGIDMSADNGICLLIIMSLFALGLLISRKNSQIPKGLVVSFIISYLLVSVSILDLSFELQIPYIIGNICFAAVLYPNFLIMGIFGMGTGFFMAAFIIDTLVIFAIIRLILFIKHKISVKKPQVKQAV
jgi:hypothetical protein